MSERMWRCWLRCEHTLCRAQYRPERYGASQVLFFYAADERQAREMARARYLELRALRRCTACNRVVSLGRLQVTPVD